MGRTASPIAAGFPARHNVHMKMRDALTSNHAVVLNQVEPVGVVSPDEGVGSPAGGTHHSGRLFIREVEQRRRVTSGQIMSNQLGRGRFHLTLNVIRNCQDRRIHDDDTSRQSICKS